MGETLRRSPLVAGLLLALAAALAIGWAWERRAAAADAARQAATEADEAERIAADFRAMRDVPVVAAVTQQSPREIADRVAAAMAAAELPDGVLRRVQPSPQPVRVPDTDYVVRTTQIELDGVTLEGVVRFGQALEDASQGMVIRRLRLLTPLTVGEVGPASDAAAAAASAGGDGDERWIVELTLTQTIFSPTVGPQ